MLRLNILKFLKKKKLKAGLLFNSAQLKIDDCKPNTANTTNKDNIDNKFETWFWNQSANKIDSNIEKDKTGNYENDLEGDESKIEEVTSSEIHKVEIK